MPLNSPPNIVPMNQNASRWLRVWSGVPINTGNWIRWVYCILAVFALLGHAAAATPKPNIVYLICDQWRGSRHGLCR